MTQEPELQKRLRKHLLDNVPELQDRPPTYDDLLPDRTPLVEAIFYEVLRLHSPVVAIPRHGRSFLLIVLADPHPISGFPSSRILLCKSASQLVL